MTREERARRAVEKRIAYVVKRYMGKTLTREQARRLVRQMEPGKGRGKGRT